MRQKNRHDEGINSDEEGKGFPMAGLSLAHCPHSDLHPLKRSVSSPECVFVYSCKYDTGSSGNNYFHAGCTPGPAHVLTHSHATVRTPH